MGKGCAGQMGKGCMPMMNPMAMGGCGGMMNPNPMMPMGMVNPMMAMRGMNPQQAAQVIAIAKAKAAMNKKAGVTPAMSLESQAAVMVAKALQKTKEMKGEKGE